MPYRFGRRGEDASFWEDNSSASPAPSRSAPADALAEFLPEVQSPAPQDSAPLVATPAADLGQLDALLVAMRGRLISLDADIDQLQELSHQVGSEYRRLAADARAPRLSRTMSTAAPVPEHTLAFASAVASQTSAAVPSTEPMSYRRARRTTMHYITIVRMPDLSRVLPWASVAAIPAAAALVGFLLAPSLGLFQGSAREPIDQSAESLPLAPSATASTAALARTDVPSAAQRLAELGGKPVPRPIVTPPAAAPARTPDTSLLALVLGSNTNSKSKPDSKPDSKTSAKPNSIPSEKPSATVTPASRPEAVPTRTLISAPKPLGFVGTLQIQSSPAGAAVYLNQKFMGETPLKLPRLRAGSHVLWVEQSGYERWTGGVLVPTDKITQVQVTLQRQHGGQ